MAYHGNTIQKTEDDEDNMSEYQVYFDSEDGSGKETVRAVNQKEAEKIVMDRGRNVVVTDAEKVGE